MKTELIVAILRKPCLRGQFRHWRAFFVETLIQHDVEEFMSFAFYSPHDYFLQRLTDLTFSHSSSGSVKPIYYYTSAKYGRHMIVETCVKVVYDKKGRKKFVIH